MTVGKLDYSQPPQDKEERQVQDPDPFAGQTALTDLVLGYLDSQELQDVRVLNRWFNRAVVIRVQREDLDLVCNFLDSLSKELPDIKISDEQKAGIRNGTSLATHAAAIRSLRDPIIQVCRALPEEQLVALRERFTGQRLPYLFQNLLVISLFYQRLDTNDYTPDMCARELLGVGEIDRALALKDSIVQPLKDNLLQAGALQCVGREFVANQFVFAANGVHADRLTQRRFGRAIHIASQIESQEISTLTLTVLNFDRAWLHVSQGDIWKGLEWHETVGKDARKDKRLDLRDIIDSACQRMSKALLDKHLVLALQIANKIEGDQERDAALGDISIGLCNQNKVQQAVEVAFTLADPEVQNSVLTRMCDAFLEKCDFVGAMKMAFLANGMMRSIMLPIITRKYDSSGHNKLSIMKGIVEASCDSELEYIKYQLAIASDNNFFIDYVACCFVNRYLSLDEVSQKSFLHDPRICAAMCAVLAYKGDYARAVRVRDAITINESLRRVALDNIVEQFCLAAIVHDEATMTVLADACSEEDVGYLIDKFPPTFAFDMRRKEEHFITYLLLHKNLTHKGAAITDRLPAYMPWTLCVRGKFKEAVEAVKSIISECVSDNTQLMACDVVSALQEIIEFTIEKGHEPAEILSLLDIFISSNEWKKFIAALILEINKLNSDEMKQFLKQEKTEKEQSRDYIMYYTISMVLEVGKIDVAEVCCDAIKNSEVKQKALKLIDAVRVR